jgi:MFS family permease
VELAPIPRKPTKLDPADLGFLTSVYFLTFAALQLPVGIWLDRYGPRRIQGALLLFSRQAETTALRFLL